MSQRSSTYTNDYDRTLGSIFLVCCMSLFAMKHS